MDETINEIENKLNQGRSTEISGIIIRLDKSIAVLGKEIMETEERLFEILKDCPKKEEVLNEDNRVSEFNTPLAKKICELDFRVSLANKRLEELRSRIEL